jgi:hypothetical protein|tara:strand:- start:360 stop:728 length:369 start_codon:yes stop_codon:yes gene_type:complete
MPDESQNTEDQFSEEEPQLIQERDRAHRATTLMTDALVREALDGMRANYTAALLAASVEEVDLVMGTKILLKQLDTFENHFAELMRTGKLAEHQLTVIANHREAGEDDRPWYARDVNPGEAI